MASIAPAELAARLQLHLLPEIGAQRFKRVLEFFGNAISALAAPETRWQALGIPLRAAQMRTNAGLQQAVSETLEWLTKPQQQLLMWDDPAYPALLAELPDAPPLLFVSGNAACLEQPQLAIVGSRQASQPGLDNARAFAKALAGAGCVITSGLALGIDAAAHQGALEVGGTTIAVVGTGLLHTYPRQHRDLAARILAQQGALVSELPLHAPAHASHFPRRNRMISGLSLGVLVVEASVASGSLITARLALEQGREVYAIPGSIHHPGARGCHRLIREGATLVEQVGDILEGLRGWQTATALPEEATPEQPLPPILALLRSAPMDTGDLAAALNWSIGQTLAALTDLELSGQVVATGTLWLYRAKNI